MGSYILAAIGPHLLPLINIFFLRWEGGNGFTMPAESLNLRLLWPGLDKQLDSRSVEWKVGPVRYCHGYIATKNQSHFYPFRYAQYGFTQNPTYNSKTRPRNG